MRARVDFYILPDLANPQRFACQLTGKAWKMGNDVYIHTDTENHADTLDDLLWTFHDTSFLPHQKMNNSVQNDAPIILGWTEQIPEHRKILVNMSENVPEFANSFDRVVEIVAGDKNGKQQARLRYKYYRDQDFDLHDHKIESLSNYE